MASHNNSGNAVSPDTLITIKISVNDSLKKLKLPLRDLGAGVLPDKLRQVLDIKPDQTFILERYSDSAGGYVTLDSNNAQVFKTLIRAAKAKLKLRLKATVTPVEPAEVKKEPMEIKKEVTIEVTPMANNIPARDSTAVDRRSVGSGIFQFREARASQQTLVNDEAPVPRPFNADRSSFFNNLAAPANPALAFRPRETLAPFAVPAPAHAWSVYCNECDKAMDNEHFHCSICDGGDYDLCQQCVSNGKLCHGEGHWLIKRFIKDGKVVNSTTERISPRKAKSVPAFIKPEPTSEAEMPGAFAEETKTLAEDVPAATRTCNSCVVVLPEREFVTCTACDDFDLCIKCHTADKHGHHPAHAFKRATEDTVLPLAAETKLAAGRNVRHNAICDGCDKKIYGVRHKCLNCPDFDYCNDCMKDARHSHPRHRFAALYQPIADQVPSMTRHFGIYCDGPLCSKKDAQNQSYIQGVRYKCTVCHDTDFCASCEALPTNHHNRTHPLIMLKTPVRNVNVSTQNEDPHGNVRVMGDRRASTETKSTATETTPVVQANAATQVQTVADFQPTEVKKETRPIPIPVKQSSIESFWKPMQGAPKPMQSASKSVQSAPKMMQPAPVPATALNAHFVRDYIPDGMLFEPEARFSQIWTLKNPGPHAWPAGCSVRYVGGDNMLNVDNSHPAAVTTIADATESNVVGREVQVGEEVAFKVILKAPARAGKAISYWRLKAADGTPFGHRLWCDIQVKEKTVPQQAAAPIPSFQAPQQTAAEHQRMQIAAAQQYQMMQRMQQQQRQAQAAAKLAGRMSQQDIGMRSSMPPVPYSSPSAVPYEQPPAYDNNTLSARLAAMREQQKQRREQMIAQLNAQRDSLQAQGIKRDDMPSFPQHVNPYMGHKAMESMNDKERREALKQRVAHIKANIIKTREEREKLAQDYNKQKIAFAERKSAEETKKVEKIIEDVVKQDEAEEKSAEEEKLEGSQMVFPKLDKESPASSTYQSATSSSSKGKAAYVENEDGEIERSATPVAAPAAPIPVADDEEEFVDLDDEIEVLSALGDESEEDDGFLTDEEYDILDASDQETVASMK